MLLTRVRILLGGCGSWPAVAMFVVVEVLLQSPVINRSPSLSFLGSTVSFLCRCFFAWSLPATDRPPVEARILLPVSNRGAAERRLAGSCSGSQRLTTCTRSNRRGFFRPLETDWWPTGDRAAPVSDKAVAALQAASMQGRRPVKWKGTFTRDVDKSVCRRVHPSRGPV